MEIISLLKPVVPHVKMETFFEKMTEAMEDYKKCPCSGCALNLKTSLTAIDLKILHEHNPEGYDKVISNALEANTMHKEITDLHDITRNTDKDK